jgi:hypothetical protein
LQIKTKIVSGDIANSKPVKQEVYGTVILPPLVFPDILLDSSGKIMIIKVPQVSMVLTKPSYRLCLILKLFYDEERVGQILS